METNKVLQFLKKFILFSNLDEDDLNNISDQLKFEIFNNGAVIINQGDYGDKMYFIYDGSVEVYMVDKFGAKFKISNLSTGDYFGELALLIDGIRTTSVRTVTKCQILSLSKDSFNLILDSHLSVSKNLNKLLSKRLGETLHLVAKKKKNTVIVMICSDESNDREIHFENYMRTLSQKTIIKLNFPFQSEEISKKINERDNHIFLLRMDLSNSITYHPADFVVNFVNNELGTIFLPKDSTTWQIEHTVRIILKKRIGIALGCGGSLGMAHISILKMFEKNNIPLDFIVGSSAGALYGCCYAFGVSMDMLMKFMINEKDNINLLTIVKNFSFTASGLMRNNYLRNIIKTLLDDKKIEEANIPFASVASDFTSGEMVIIKSGSVIEGLLASNAAPVLFEPIRINNRLLIDGIATAPLPTQVLYDENIDIKIAVPIQQLDSNIEIIKNPKLYTIYLRSRAIMAEKLVRLSSSLADIVIAPKIKLISGSNWRIVDKILQAGEDSANEAIAKIQCLLTKPQ